MTTDGINKLKRIIVLHNESIQNFRFKINKLEKEIKNRGLVNDMHYETTKKQRKQLRTAAIVIFVQLTVIIYYIYFSS